MNNSLHVRVLSPLTKRTTQNRLVIRVSGLCPSSVTKRLDIGWSAIVDNRIEELRCTFIQCVANVSRLLKLRARGDIPVFVALSQVPTFALVH